MPALPRQCAGTSKECGGRHTADSGQTPGIRLIPGIRVSCHAGHHPPHTSQAARRLARRRRRDLAVLKVLGLLRRELSAVTFWQVSTITAVALAVGTPLGIAGGRWAWQLFAHQAGLPGGAVTPLPLLWMIPLTLAAANLVALPTARRAARLSAAATLRSE